MVIQINVGDVVYLDNAPYVVEAIDGDRALVRTLSLLDGLIFGWVRVAWLKKRKD